MSDPVYNRLVFNGFMVVYFDHERCSIEADHYPTADTVRAKGFKDGFPDAQEFADDLYNVFGDVVGSITDNDGVVLLNNMDEMHDTHRTVVTWP